MRMRLKMNASNILVDSFAWLEILNGSERGEIALSVIKESNKVFTSVLNIYEIKYRIEQIRDEEIANDCITTIRSHTNVLNIDEEIALAGARIRLEHKMGAVDSLILATAILHDLKVLTGDQHFEGMAEAVMI